MSNKERPLKPVLISGGALWAAAGALYGIYQLLPRDLVTLEWKGWLAVGAIVCGIAGLGCFWAAFDLHRRRSNLPTSEDLLLGLLRQLDEDRGKAWGAILRSTRAFFDFLRPTQAIEQSIRRLQLRLQEERLKEELSKVGQPQPSPTRQAYERVQEILRERDEVLKNVTDPRIQAELNRMYEAKVKAVVRQAG